MMRTSIDSVTATPTVSPVSSLMRREGSFEEDIARVLEDIELAKRLQRVVAALHLDREF